MPIIICPRCQQRVLVDKYLDDVNHECNSGNSTLDEEDVVVHGDWEDFTGTGVGNNANTQGTENTLFGTRAGIEGIRRQPNTDRGATASTHRQRQHIENINLEGGN